MSDIAWTPDLGALADRYEVLGELRGTDQLRSYVGHRTSDGTDVVILVARAPKGGGNNDLTHFAADTQLLTNIGHPAMPRVLEGRWLGGNSVAVVSERVRGSTLSAATSGDEPLSFPRVAAVLQQVNGVMEWARTHGVVHRGVSLDSITLEDGTGRVMVSLVPTAIPMEGVPDACADSRVLGALAFELLTGEPYNGDDPMAQMKELRPQLSRRVQEEVRGMLECQSAQPVPDVHTFIAMIAAADEMRIGEEERARLEAEMVQAHRLDCERWEAQRKQLEDRIAEDDRRLKLQQTALETSEAEHRDRLAADLAALEAQRREADERTRVAEEQAERADARMQELESRAKELEARAKELEARAKELEGRSRSLDSREAELRQKQASMLPPAESVTETHPKSKSESIVAAAVAPFAIGSWRRTPKEVEVVPAKLEGPADVVAPDEEEAPVEAAVVPEVAAERPRLADRSVTRTVAPVEAVTVPDDDEPKPWGGRSWTLPASAIGLVLLVVLGIALAHHHPATSAAGPVRIGHTTVVPTPAPIGGAPTATPMAPLTVSDSAAGSVETAVRLDSVAQRIARDSMNAASAASGGAGSHGSAAPTHRSTERSTPTETDSAPVYGPPAASDSMVLVPIPANAVVPARIVDSTRSHRDTPPRDSTGRRDTTVNRDTTARADTIRPSGASPS